MCHSCYKTDRSRRLAGETAPPPQTNECGHTERPHHAKGKCHMCYRRDRCALSAAQMRQLTEVDPRRQHWAEVAGYSSYGELVANAIEYSARKKSDPEYRARVEAAQAGMR